MVWFPLPVLQSGNFFQSSKQSTERMEISTLDSRWWKNGGQWNLFHWRIIDDEDKGYITIWQKLYFKNCNKVPYFYYNVLLWIWTSKVVLMVKNWLANAGDRRDVGSIHGLGRYPGGGNGNPLQYSCRENPMDRGVWQVAHHEDCSPWGCK